MEDPLRSIVIPISRSERNALQEMAEIEIRGIKDQARWLIRQSLMAAGYLQAPESAEESDGEQYKRPVM